jgi:hypothetical protein
MRTRYEAEHARLGGTARIIERPEASGRAKVGHIDTPDSFVDFRAAVAKRGKYVLSVRYGNGMPDKETANHQVSVNGVSVGQIPYRFSGWDNWSNVFLSVHLDEGANSIRFNKGNRFGEIDCIDLFLIEE